MALPFFKTTRTASASDPSGDGAKRRLFSSTALQQHARDEDGGIIWWSMFTIIGMLMATGLGVTLQFYEINRANLQNTLDRAVLAATDLDQTIDAEEVIADYVKRAGLEGALTDAKVENGINYRTSTAEAGVKMNTIFTPGVDVWEVDAESTAIESITDVEIALVLDNSGSMGWSDDYRLNLLKPAAKTFVDTVTRPIEGIQNGSVTVSLVPFSTQVNAGPLLADELNFTDQHTHSHCARFEEGDYASTAITPSTELQRGGHFDIFTWNAPVTTSGVVCPFDSSRHVTPWAREAQVLKDQIDAMWAGGNTSMDVATKWGAALLDPAMAPVFNTLADDEGSGIIDPLGSQPFSFTRDNTLKVLVVMSDGQNTDEFRLKSAYRSGESPVFEGAGGEYSYFDEDRTSDPYYSVNDGTWDDEPAGDNAQQVDWVDLLNDMSVARYALDIKSPAMGGSWRTYYDEMYTRVPAWQKNNRTSAICAAARDAGIIVYTIGMDTYGQGDATLEDCAGTPVNFFDVEALQIEVAFSAIAQQINQLRLTQ